jgi:hypothetical protein
VFQSMSPPPPPPPRSARPSCPGPPWALTIVLSQTLPPPLPAAPAAVRLDDYLEYVGKHFYGIREVGAATRDFAIVRRTTLGRLTSPVRESPVVERWAPVEVAKFESAICLVGKAFPQIAAAVGTKSTAEVIEFYYAWKQSKNYASWKASYTKPELPEGAAAIVEG